MHITLTVWIDICRFVNAFDDDYIIARKGIAVLITRIIELLEAT